MARVARRFGAWRTLGRAVLRGRRPGAPRLGQRVRALPRLVGAAVTGRYPGLGRGRLLGLALAVAYVVSPVDVVPELLLSLLGLGDDALVGLFLAGSFLDETDRFVRWERGEPPTRP